LSNHRQNVVNVASGIPDGSTGAWYQAALGAIHAACGL